MAGVTSVHANPAQPLRIGVQTAGRKAYLRRRRQEILAETAEALLAGKDPDSEVMPALFLSLAAEKIVDGTLGYIVTNIEEGMKLGFMEGFDQAMIQRCLTLDFGQAVCGTVAATRRPMQVGNIQGSLDPMTELVRSAGINAYACEPLVAGGRLLGTMSFASRARRAFDAEDLSFFRAVAKQLAIARGRALRARKNDTAA